MKNNMKYNVSNHAKPLLKNIPERFRENSNNQNIHQHDAEQYEIKINLESIHYTGKDYGYGWTIVTSIMKRYWISDRIQMRRGVRSVVDKTIFQKTTNTRFYSLQHMPITISAQHASGVNIETSLQLQSNALRTSRDSTSIFPEAGTHNTGFKFHELHTVEQDNVQFMFVLDIEITPIETAKYRN